MVSHEVGHNLGLYHTHQGSGLTYPSSNPNFCYENVNGSKCDTCGDFVCDTPADRFTFVDSNHIMNNCLYNWWSIWNDWNTRPVGSPALPLLYSRIFDHNGDT